MDGGRLKDREAGPCEDLSNVFDEALRYAQEKGKDGVDWPERLRDIGCQLSQDYELGSAVESIYAAADEMRSGRPGRELLLQAMVYTASAMLSPRL